MDEKITAYLSENLKKSRRGKLSFIETRRLKKAGEADAKTGVIREDKYGISGNPWTSSTIKQMLKSNEEEQLKFLGVVLNGVEDMNRDRNELYEKIKFIEGQKEALQKKVVIMPSEAELTTRFKGEADLSDNQIRKRRMRQANAKLAKIEADCQKLSDEAQLLYERLNNIHSTLTEIIRLSRLVCEKMNLNTEQRIDCYWSGAVVHLRGDNIPAIYVMDEELKSFTIYNEIWDKLNAVENLISSYGREKMLV